MNNQKFADPIVSIIILTFNSSEFVLETLESAKAQTYKNIELIVSDDCSTDDTVALCRKWLDENKGRFARTKLLTSPKNTGISPNCNRGLKVVKGEWIKYMAGDDILVESCIKDFVDYSKKNSDHKIIFGKMYFLKNGTLTEEEKKSFYSLSQENQYLKILKGCGIPSQTCFINTQLIMELKGFDERYKFIEDAPFLIKASEKGIRFVLINKFVIKYRLHNNNISGISRGTKFVNEVFYNDTKKIIKEEVIPRLKKLNKHIIIFNKYNELFIYQLILLLGNKNNLISKFLKLFMINSTIKRCLNRIRLFKLKIGWG